MTWPVKLFAAAVVIGMLQAPVNGELFTKSMIDNDADRQSMQIKKEKVNAGKFNFPRVKMSQIAKP